MRSLWKGGIGVDKLTSMVLNYKTSPEIKNIIICIGTNDAFQNQNIKDLFKIINPHSSLSGVFCLYLFYDNIIKFN